VTWSQFHSEDPQMLGATVQNLVVQYLCTPNFINMQMTSDVIPRQSGHSRSSSHSSINVNYWWWWR
jgi:hypothetical protein